MLRTASSNRRLFNALRTASFSTQRLSFAKYPFLKDLGLKEHNLGVYDGQWGGSGPSFTSVNPATNEAIATVSTGTAEEYEQAISKMQTAKAAWAELPAPRRGEIVRKIGSALRQYKDPLGALVSLEMGKILSEGKGEVQEAIDICDYAVGLSRMLSGSVLPSERPGHFMMERWNPLKGHVGIITAFNFPCAVYFWNAAISMVAGNTQIWKGADTTPLTTIACTRIVSEVLEAEGLHGSIASCINGTGPLIGERMVRDPRVELVSFTGSTHVGRHISANVAQRFGKRILELGGNNAMIVMKDADLKMASRAALFSAVGTAGQRCTTLRRLYVQNEVFESFVSTIVKAYSSVKIGDPLDASTLCGPLHTKRAVEQFRQGVEAAKKQGGKVLFGGNVLSDRAGNFVQPTVIEIDPEAPVTKEEIFVPILYVSRIRDLKHAIELNNAVPHGLSSSLFTTNQASIFEWTGPNGSDCGIVNVNIGTSGAEIGGAFGGEKDTGGGRESGSDSWKQYMRRSTCTINHSKDLPLAQGVNFDV